MSEKKKGRGVRYSVEQKQEVLDFVKANPGRGAMKQAQDKFGVSYVAIRNWLEDAGQERPKRAAKAEGGRSKAGRKADGGRFDKARKLLDRIQGAEAELRGLYADLSDLLKP